MGGAVGKAPLSFQLHPHQPERHTALLQGHLAWPLLGTAARSAEQAGAWEPALHPHAPRGRCSGSGRTHQERLVVEQTIFLGAAEA